MSEGSPFQKGKAKAIGREKHPCVKFMESIVEATDDVFQNNIPSDAVKDMPSNYRYMFGVLIYAGMIATFVYFFYSVYENTATTQYLALEAADGATCNTVYKAFSGDFLADINGNFEGAKNFDFTQALYRFNFQSFLELPKSLMPGGYPYTQTLENLIGQNIRVIAAANAQNFASHNVAQNLVSLSMATFESFTASADGPTPEGAPPTINVQTFRFTADATTFFNTDAVRGGMGSGEATCGVVPSTTYSSTQHKWTISWDYDLYVADSNCLKLLHPYVIGILSRPDHGLISLSVDSRSVFAAQAANWPDESSFNNVSLYRSYMEGTLRPITGTSLHNVTFIPENGKKGYNASEYFDPNFPDMDPITCIIPAYSKSKRRPACMVHLGSGLFAVPVFNHQGVWKGYEQNFRENPPATGQRPFPMFSPCTCPLKYSAKVAEAIGTPFACNIFDFITGLIFFPRDPFDHYAGMSYFTDKKVGTNTDNPSKGIQPLHEQAYLASVYTPFYDISKIAYNSKSPTQHPISSPTPSPTLSASNHHPTPQPTPQPTSQPSNGSTFVEPPYGLLNITAQQRRDIFSFCATPQGGGCSMIAFHNYKNSPFTVGSISPNYMSLQNASCNSNLAPLENMHLLAANGNSPVPNTEAYRICQASSATAFNTAMGIAAGNTTTYTAIGVLVLLFFLYAMETLFGWPSIPATYSKNSRDDALKFLAIQLLLVRDKLDHLSKKRDKASLKSVFRKLVRELEEEETDVHTVATASGGKKGGINWRRVYEQCFGVKKGRGANLEDNQKSNISEIITSGVSLNVLHRKDIKLLNQGGGAARVVEKPLEGSAMSSLILNLLEEMDRVETNPESFWSVAAFTVSLQDCSIFWMPDRIRNELTNNVDPNNESKSPKKSLASNQDDSDDDSDEEAGGKAGKGGDSGLSNTHAVMTTLTLLRKLMRLHISRTLSIPLIEVDRDYATTYAYKLHFDVEVTLDGLNRAIAILQKDSPNPLFKPR